jgi:hypothetical protein
MEPAAIFFWCLLAALVIGVIIVIARSSSEGMGGGGGAGMPGVTALHDLSPADKQRAIEIVIEAKAGKKWMEQESGKKKDEDKPSGKP